MSQPLRLTFLGFAHSPALLIAFLIELLRLKVDGWILGIHVQELILARLHHVMSVGIVRADVVGDALAGADLQLIQTLDNR